MLNLNSTIDLDFKSFWRWWTRELGFLLPEPLKRLINDKQGFLVICPEQGGLALSYHCQGQTEALALIGRDGMGIEAFKALQEADPRLAKSHTVLRLSRHEAIHTELSLPAAVKENLLQVVGYELDKYSPFKIGQVYYAIQPLPKANEPGHLAVRLIMAPKAHLDALYEDAKVLGLSPLFADCQGAPNDLDDDSQRYDLLPENYRPKVAKTPRLIYSSLVATWLLLLVAALVLPIWLKAQTVGQLQDRVSAIEKEAKKIKAMQSEMNASVEETQKLIDHKTALPSMVAVFNELSTIINDDTWLAYAQYSGGHLQIQGESPSASALISVLEASGLFANTKFVSPVTQDNISKLERFQITTDVTKPEVKDDKAE